MRPRESSSRTGCLRLAAGTAVLVLVAPAATLVRQLRAWRRGGEEHLSWAWSEAGAAGVELNRLEVEADVPLRHEVSFRTRLTDAVVRIAEVLRQPDDVYHLVYRLPSDSEAVVLPVGPQVQELGERFSLALSRPGLAGRTLVWMTLPADRRLGQVVDPRRVDPEREGEPEQLILGAGVHWGAAVAFTTHGAAMIHRLVLYLPPSARRPAEAALERLRQSGR
jgi:hypothetical protein